jgi:DNA ligase (NAD+)
MNETHSSIAISIQNYKNLIKDMEIWQRAYDEGHPIISDMEWDDYYTALLRLEQELGYADPESPSQRVHYDVVTELKKVEHNHPMLSLDKTKDIEEIKAFISDHDWICMAKMDGLTCSLHYRGGRLVRAETRGNGLVGEDITHNAYKIPSIPKTIDSTYDTVVDGEIICTYNNFEKFNTEYSNPRNFASGSIRLLDSNECAKRGLEFVAWDLINGYDKFDGGNTLSQKLIHLQALGFITVCWRVPAFEYGETLEEVIDSVKRFCNDKTYPIDGLVFKYNDCEEYEAAGRTEHHFRGGLAYKFYDELYETKLLNIEWSMGRTGVLTPVAIVEEIEIDGAMISRASLHNVSVMNELLGQPFVGQKVRIFRANQIIPQVYDAEKSDLSISELRIDKCPMCGERLKLNNNDGVITLICPNEDCDGKLLNRLDHFVSKKGLDIKGLSKATLEKLMDWGWVETEEDLFTLWEFRNEWIKKEGFGVKSVDNILAAIDASKTTELYQFISSLGIPLIGISVSKELVKIFDSYESFREAVAAGYEFWKLPNFGDAKHNALINFDYSQADRMRVYLNLTNKMGNVTIKSSQPLKDLTFCVTGKLKSYKNRAEIKTIIEQNGGRCVDSVSSKTNYLINNDFASESSKNKTAKSLGIPIITEEQFKDLLN